MSSSTPSNTANQAQSQHRATRCSTSPTCPASATSSPNTSRPALDVLLADAKAAVDHASAPETPATWRDIVESVERASERLSRAWGVIGHLNAVADTPELRAAHAENLPRVTEFSASVGQNLALYEKYKAIAASEEHRSLSVEQKKMLSNELRGFRLSGAELPEDKKPRFARIAGRTGGAVEGIFRSRARCHQRVFVPRRPRKANWRACRKT